MMADRKERPLGETQIRVLDSLARHNGSWWPACGWIWTSTSETVRLMESLLRRGLVSKREMEGPYGRKADRYDLTPIGWSTQRGER